MDLTSILRNWKLFVAIVGILGAFVFGYNLASDKWENKYNEREVQIATETAKEQDRQYRANERAKELEQKRIETIRDLESELNEINERNSEEAAADPDRDRIGVNADGVLRLNRIK